MLQGFSYAYGPAGDSIEATPASAFSKGDLLMLDSTSSVSRIAELFPSGVDIYAVADGDSTQSINGKCKVTLVDQDTTWLASLSTNISAVTPGVECDIAFSTANGRAYVTNASANSVRATVVRGTAGPMALDQSVNSQVLVKLIRHAGNVEL